MQSLKCSRVLIRQGARELTLEENQQVTGGVITSILTRCPTADHHTDG